MKRNSRTTFIPFASGELEYLTDCISEKLIKARNMLREHEEVIAHENKEEFTITGILQ